MPAPPGNTNALKHGLYARHFSRKERAALKRVDPLDLSFEIAAARVAADRLFTLIESTTDPEIAAKLHNSLTAALAEIGGLAARLGILSGKYPALDEAIDDALASVDFFLPPD